MLTPLPVHWYAIVASVSLTVPAAVNVWPSCAVPLIDTPDKANAVFRAGLSLALNDADPDYAGLRLADYILGSDTLSSRLGNRVRDLRPDGGADGEVVPFPVDVMTGHLAAM